MIIDTLDSLRTLYSDPQPRAVRKEIATLDRHCRDFIALSPFLILSTSDREHNLDASPRGGDPGFVKISDVGDVGDLLIPDAPGNNRLDSFRNIVDTDKVDRSALPSAGRMISDQTGLYVPPETKEDMERRYQADL